MIKLLNIKKKKWIIIGATLAVIICIFLVVIRRNSSNSAEFSFAVVERGDMENTISSTGTLNAKGTVEVGTQVSGTINKVSVDFNDRVRKNQILAVLDTTLLAAAVREAEANLIKAQAQHDLSLAKCDDAQELRKDEFISELDFETAKTDYETARASLLSAQASLTRAQVNLKYAVIRSPISGTVINRGVEPGQTVAASFSTPTLFVITEDLSQMEIHAYVDESDIGQIKEGQSVRFTVESYPDETFDGTVREIRLQPETIQNVVNYTVVVDASNDKALFLPGMTATVDFLVEQKKDVLLISNAAIRYQPSSEMLVQFRKRRQEKTSAFPDSTVESRGQTLGSQGQQGGFPGVAGMGEVQPPDDIAFLWYFDDENRLSMMPIRTGMTDGARTEIIQGHGIKEGMRFISGEGGQSASKSAQQEAGQPPGPPPIF